MCPLDTYSWGHIILRHRYVFGCREPQWACHATDGPPTNGPAGPSMANFVAINGPAGPSMAAMDGPAGLTTAP